MEGVLFFEGNKSFVVPAKLVNLKEEYTMKYILFLVAVITIASGLGVVVGQKQTAMYHRQPLSEIALHAEDLKPVLCISDYGDAETFYVPKDVNVEDYCK